MLNIKLGIIGCGNMGEAIIKGIISKKLINRKNIYVSDKIRNKTANLGRRYGIKVQFLNSNVARKSNVIILAVKPQDAQILLNEIRYFLDKSKLVISIMAGIKIKNIEGLIGRAVPIARVMPNMAAFVGESMSAISYNKFVKNRDRNIVKKLFIGIGEIVEIKERMQDPFTALIGSGPAYYFYLVECFVEAAMKQGFTRKEAIKLVKQTIKGSARVLNLSGVTPRFLREKVTSKGGTTETAIKIFSKRALKKIILDAIEKATQKSKQLSGR